jgi:hypothetical protein
MDAFKKPWVLVLSAVIALGLLLLIVLLATSPTRTLNKFENQILAGDYDSAFALLSTTVAREKIDNADYFISDWSYADEISMERTSETSWLQRTELDAEGNVVKNKHGDRSVEVKPAPKYWARFYEAEMTVEFDGFEDPVIIRLRRKSSDGWSPLAQIFRGWEITKIVYQPLGDEDFEELDLDEYYELGDDFELDFGDEQELLVDDEDLELELESEEDDDADLEAEDL